MIEHKLGDPPIGSNPGPYCYWPNRTGIIERPTIARWIARVRAMIDARKR